MGRAEDGEVPQGVGGVVAGHLPKTFDFEQGDLDRTQVDTLRRYAEALGGDLRVEFEFEGERVELS